MQSWRLPCTSKLPSETDASNNQTSTPIRRCASRKCQRSKCTFCRPKGTRAASANPACLPLLRPSATPSSPPPADVSANFHQTGLPSRLNVSPKLGRCHPEAAQSVGGRISSQTSSKGKWVATCYLGKARDRRKLNTRCRRRLSQIHFKHTHRLRKPFCGDRR